MSYVIFWLAIIAARPYSGSAGPFYDQGSCERARLTIQAVFEEQAASNAYHNSVTVVCLPSRKP